MAKKSLFKGPFTIAKTLIDASNFRHMVVEWLQDLLILQDRDARSDGIQRQLDDIPRKITVEEASIRELQERLEAAAGELKALEVRRLDLEGEIAQTEATILKYKTQQLLVKKNEEYTALEHEITTLQNKISDLEDQELQIMEDLDQKTEELEGSRESLGQEQKTLEAHIERLRSNYDTCAGELDEAREAVKACEAVIKADVLQQYHYVKGQVKRPPYVVALEEGRCKGCHLKVSGEVESDSRKGHNLVRCDSCGRILYFDR